MKKEFRIRIPLPKIIKRRVERVEKKQEPVVNPSAINRSRRKFLKNALLFGGAALAGMGFNEWINRRAREEEQKIFTPSRSGKEPEFVHLEPSVTQVENAIQSILKNPGYNRIALERTAWFHEFILKHASLQQVDPYLLYALVAQESRGAMTAESHAGAGGLAQFMPETGENYDLYALKQLVSSKKTPVYRTIGDERLDPDSAIGAAAEHLKDLVDYYAQRGYLNEKQREAEYKAMGLDPYAAFFALAAYNAGYNRIDKAIAKTLDAGVRATWPAVAEHLRAETQNYVPLILAKKIILENLEHFGSEHGLNVSKNAFGAYTQLLDLTEAKQLQKTSIRTFARLNKLNEEHLQLLNPHLKTDVWLKEAEIRVPKKEEAENFRDKFQNFKNLCWNNFAYHEHEKTNEQAACEHITRAEIMESLAKLVPPRPQHLTERFPLKLKQKLRERRA